MCGYDPFWIIESMLDEEYKERTGNSMQGFKQAQAEYEKKMTDPYRDDYTEEWEEEDPEVDRRLEDRDN